MFCLRQTACTTVSLLRCLASAEFKLGAGVSVLPSTDWRALSETFLAALGLLSLMWPA